MAKRADLSVGEQREPDFGGQLWYEGWRFMPDRREWNFWNVVLLAPVKLLLLPRCKATENPILPPNEPRVVVEIPAGTHFHAMCAYEYGFSLYQADDPDDPNSQIQVYDGCRCQGGCFWIYDYQSFNVCLRHKKGRS